jgi:hypothetical protein
MGVNRDCSSQVLMVLEVPAGKELLPSDSDPCSSLMKPFFIGRLTAKHPPMPEAELVVSLSVLSLRRRSLKSSLVIGIFLIFFFQARGFSAPSPSVTELSDPISVEEPPIESSPLSPGSLSSASVSTRSSAHRDRSLVDMSG